MTIRAKNEASVDSIEKLIRANAMTFDHAALSQEDLDLVCDRYQGFLCDLVALTKRPTSGLLTKAAEGTWKLPKASAVLFGQRVAAAVQHVRQKWKSKTSGKKLHSAVRRIGSILINEQALATSTSRRRSDGSRDEVLSSSCLAEGGEDEVQQLRAFYGLTTRPQRPPSAALSSHAVEIVSSQEAVLDASREVAAASQEVADGEQDAGNTSVVQYEDSVARCVVRLVGDKIIKGSMAAGPSGLAVAAFGTDIVQSTIPNEVLTMTPAVMKRPSAHRGKASTRAPKKPKPPAAEKIEGTASEECMDEAPDVLEAETGSPEVDKEEEATQEYPSDVCEDPEEITGVDGSTDAAIVPEPRQFVMTYVKMYYKRNNSFGIREAMLGKRQIFSISAKNGRVMTKDDLLSIADRALASLHSGSPVDVVKQWCQEVTS